jgi:hypothetical protein
MEPILQFDESLKRIEQEENLALVKRVKMTSPFSDEGGPAYERRRFGCIASDRVDCSEFDLSG